MSGRVSVKCSYEDEDERASARETKAREKAEAGGRRVTAGQA